LFFCHGRESKNILGIISDHGMWFVVFMHQTSHSIKVYRLIDQCFGHKAKIFLDARTKMK
jgi:hypothetical protein